MEECKLTKEEMEDAKALAEAMRPAWVNLVLSFYEMTILGLNNCRIKDHKIPQVNTERCRLPIIDELYFLPKAVFEELSK